MNADLKRDYRSLCESLETAEQLLESILEQHGEHPVGLSPLACSPLWGRVAAALEMSRMAQRDLIEQRDDMLGSDTVGSNQRNRVNGKSRI